MDTTATKSTCLEYLDKMEKEISRISTDSESSLLTIKSLMEKINNQESESNLLKLIDQLEELIDTEILLK